MAEGRILGIEPVVAPEYVRRVRIIGSEVTNPCEEIELPTFEFVFPTYTMYDNMAYTRADWHRDFMSKPEPEEDKVNWQKEGF